MIANTVKINVKDLGIEPDKPFLSIGSAAKTLNVHQRTLRIYDEQKILVPGRSELNRRLYSINDMVKANFILFLTRNLAINLAGVKIILSLLDASKADVHDYMDIIKKTAKTLDISEEVLEYNAKRLSKRGKRTGANDITVLEGF